MFVLLIIVGGMKENTWCKSLPLFQLLLLTAQDLLVIGLLGSVQYFVVAGVQRSPSALGIHIKQVDVIQARFVADMLSMVERKYALVGIAPLNVFFPDSMCIQKDRVSEKEIWRKALEARCGNNKHGISLDRLPLIQERQLGGLRVCILREAVGCGLD